MDDCIDLNTIELHLYWLIGTVSNPDKQTIRIIGFFFENRLHRIVGISAVTIYIMYLGLKLSTTPDLKS